MSKISLTKVALLKVDPRMIVFILTLALFAIGAGAPIASGGIGGNSFNLLSIAP